MISAKPERPQCTYRPADGLGDTLDAWLVYGCRLYGGADVNGVRYWYHPPTDQLVRADRWFDIVGDPDAPPEPLSESFVD